MHRTISFGKIDWYDRGRKDCRVTVEHEGKPYTYGTGWLYEPIPDDDLARIRDIIDPDHGEEVDA